MVRYGYHDKKERKWVGYFECDEEDFKKLWSRIRDDVSVCYLSRGQKHGEMPEEYRYLGYIGWERIK